MPFSQPLFGVVVAGGRSRRFGRDKRLATWRGRALLAHATATLREVVGPRLLLAAADSLPSPGLGAGTSRIRDAAVGAGPLAAVVAGLLAVPGDLLVLAGDVPRVDAATLRVLAASCARSGRVAALQGLRGPEPLVACWPQQALRPAQAALREGVPSLARILERLGARTVQLDRARALNVNRPQDLDQLEAWS